jgi:CubicO group peptidase (beta-lactamase class C family)
LDALKKRPGGRSVRARIALAAIAALAAAPVCAQTAEPTQLPASAASGATGARVEARSAQLLAVGTVHGDRMTIHLSRLEDNAPVRDAEVALVLRGVTHSATALADGGYAVVTPDLALPGTAAVRFEVTSGGARQQLEGTLQPAAAAESTEDKGSSRQLGWWILNFAVCIGFLWLWQRRKRHDPDEEPQS